MVPGARGRGLKSLWLHLAGSTEGRLGGGRCFNSYGLLKTKTKSGCLRHLITSKRKFPNSRLHTHLRTITHLISRSRYFYRTRGKWEVRSVVLRSASHSWYQGLFSCVWFREGERSWWEVTTLMGSSLLSFAAPAFPDFE